MGKSSFAIEAEFFACLQAAKDAERKEQYEVAITALEEAGKRTSDFEEHLQLKVWIDHLRKLNST